MALSLPGSRGESLKRESEKLKKKNAEWPDWTQQTVVCMASGPSLTVEDIALVKNQREHGAMTVNVIAINDCGLRRREPLAAPWADVLYAADSRWWQFYNPAFTGLRLSGEPVAPLRLQDGLTVEVETIPLEVINSLPGPTPMPRKPGSVIHGQHSGFQALGFALSCGATRILLLGYDCGPIRGQRNAHKDREPAFMRQAPWPQWLRPYEAVPKQWPNVEIVNCAMESNLQTFQKRPLREVL
jgi:hypothetical protein